MQGRALRHWCRGELQDLDLEPPLEVASLCERIGQRRGRPIRLVPRPLPVPGPSGLWLATASRDYIVFQSETTRLHRDHIVLHEVGHILAGHTSEETDTEDTDTGSADSAADERDADDWRAAMPDLSPEMVLRALGRTCYDAEREREAEMIATVLMSWTTSSVGGPDRAATTGPLRRLASAFGHQQPWRE